MSDDNFQDNNSNDDTSLSSEDIKDKNNTLEISLDADDLLLIMPDFIDTYIKYKIFDTCKTIEKINIKEIHKNLNNIYIYSDNRLSTKLEKQKYVDQLKSHYPEKDEKMLIQVLLQHMNKSLPSSHTIIEFGECSLNEIDYLYLLAVENNIISFIENNKNSIDNIYFSKNITKDSETNYLNNNIYLSDKVNEFINEIPTKLIDCTVYKKFCGQLIPSLVTTKLLN